MRASQLALVPLLAACAKHPPVERAVFALSPEPMSPRVVLQEVASEGGGSQLVLGWTGTVEEVAKDEGFVQVVRAGDLIYAEGDPTAPFVGLALSKMKVSLSLDAERRPQEILEPETVEAVRAEMKEALADVPADLVGQIWDRIDGVLSLPRVLQSAQEVWGERVGGLIGRPSAPGSTWTVPVEELPGLSSSKTLSGRGATVTYAVEEEVDCPEWTGETGCVWVSVTTVIPSDALRQAATTTLSDQVALLGRMGMELPVVQVQSATRQQTLRQLVHVHSLRWFALDMEMSSAVEATVGDRQISLSRQDRRAATAGPLGEVPMARLKERSE